MLNQNTVLCLRIWFGFNSTSPDDSNNSKTIITLSRLQLRVVLSRAYRGLTSGFFFAPEFQCYYLCESSCLFYLSLNSDFYVS